MDTAELDVALEELELRLERLRALYEQYFMGLEKIEPAIARKDVDRRIYVLRREKIRNTAKRFKLQTIIQRYNTFQQYWQRICREIENGTYKRHLLKAQKNGELLTIAARKRLGRQARTSQPPAAAAPSSPPSAPPTQPPAVDAPLPAPPPAEPLAAALPTRPLGSPPPLRRPPLPGRPPEPTTTPSAANSKPLPAKFESLDLDMDFMGDWDPGATRGPSPKAPAPKPAAPSTQAKPVAKPVATPSPPSPPSPGPTRPASIPPAPVAVPPRPASSRPPTAPARPPTPRAPLPTRPVAPTGVAAIPASAAARPVPPRPPAPMPAAPPPAAVKPAPAAAPKPAPAAATTKPAAVTAAAASGQVDDTRLRDLHARLQQAKQQTKEANVSFEGLAKSIRATEAKLREQHKNRKIDFDVVIKDGKAVVKPIVR